MILKGTLNGVDIAFIDNGFGVYTAVVPRQLTGIYIIQLFVEDGGWSDSFSGVFVRIDFNNMVFKVLDPAYTWVEREYHQESYGYKPMKERLSVKSLNSEKYVCKAIAGYTIREVL